MKQKYITAKQIAEAIDGKVVGDETLPLFAFSLSRDAKEGDLTYASTEKEILQSNASAYITRPLLSLQADKTYIYNPYEIDEVMDLIVNLFVQLKDTPEELNLSYEIKDYVKYGYQAIIGDNTTIEPFTTIGAEVRIGRNCRIGSNVEIGKGVRIGDNVKISSGCKLGVDNFQYAIRDHYYKVNGLGSLLIGNHVEIGYNTVVQKGTLSNTIIGDYTVIANLVDIGHDVIIGQNCKIVSQTGIAGRAVIGNGTTIYGQVGIANDVIIGDNVIIKGKSRVSKDIKSNMVISGYYAQDNRKELNLQATLRRLIKNTEGKRK